MLPKRSVRQRTIRRRHLSLLTSTSLETLEERKLLAALAFTSQIPTVRTAETLPDITVSVPGGGSGLVSLSLGTNPGSMRLGGSTAVQASGGTAVFKNLFLFGGDPTKNYTFLANAGGYDPATSNAFSVKAGPDNLLISQVATSAVAGTHLGAAGAPIQVQILSANGTLDLANSTTSVMLLLDQNPGGASFVDASGNILTSPLVANASNGVASFPDVRLNKAGSGYTFVAITTNLPVQHRARSEPFAIVAAPAAGVSFATFLPDTGKSQPINMFGRQPSFVQDGIKVQGVDKFGNFAADFIGMVNLSLGNNPGNATLGGLLEVQAANGIAFFNSININQLGAGYTILASSPGLGNPATSNPFTIINTINQQLKMVAPGKLSFGIEEKLPSIQVQILDDQGNQITTDNWSQVTLGPIGVLFGDTTVTAVNGVATFDNVSIGKRTIGSNSTIDLQANYAVASWAPSNTVQITVTPGAPHLLKFLNGAVNSTTAGSPLKTATNDWLTVAILDSANNVVPINDVVISLGVNQAEPNSNPTYLGRGTDPTISANLALYQTQKTVAGLAVFDNLFINRASTDYQLAAGTTGFYNFSATVTETFNVSIGAPSAVKFVWQPVQAVGSRRVIPGDGATLSVALTDKVGNVVVSNSQSSITLSANIPSNVPGAPPSLETKDPAGLTKQVVNGVAIFDAVYIDQAAAEVVTGYSLNATSAGLTSTTSRPFEVQPPPAQAMPDAFTLTTPPPATLAPGAAFSLTYTVVPPANSGIVYGPVEVVALYLVDAVTGVPTSGFGLEGLTAQPLPDGSNSVTFTGLSVPQAGSFKIRAILNFGGNVDLSPTFQVGSAGTGFQSALVTASATPDTNPYPVGVGLGSYIQNFNYYQSLPIYVAKKVPPNQPASTPETPFELVQPNVTPPNNADPSLDFFDQAPITSKWWSAQMFQRTPAVNIDQKDSKGNRLFPLFADPFAMMVNSNDGSPGQFAGLGLTRLNELFVNPAPQYLDPPVPGQSQTKPNPLYGGNDRFFYTYYGLYQADQRLYQDLSVGLQGMTADATILRYSDWTATLNWSDSTGVPRLQALVGEGMPFAYFTAPNIAAGGKTPMQIVTGNPRWTNVNVTAVPFNPATGTFGASASSGTGAFQLNISYEVTELASPSGSQTRQLQVQNSYGIYLPPGAAWNFANNTITFDLTAAANFVSVATLPDATVATFADYYSHAYSFVTGTTTDFSYDETTSLVTTTFVLETNQVATGPGITPNSPLQGLYVNLYTNLLPGTPLTAYKYATARGTMKVFAGSSFATQLKHTGTLPQTVPLPSTSNLHTNLWRNAIYPYLLTASTGGPNDGSLNLASLLPVFNNNYQEGQAMLGAAQLIPILNEVADCDPTANPALSQADRELARSTARRIFTLVKDRMSAWLSSNDDNAPYMLYNQPAAPLEDPQGAQAGKIGWQALTPIQAGFLSTEGINDQNLIEGYFVKTAAILAQYDRGWGDTSVPYNNGNSVKPSNYGDLINMMIKNVANTDRNDRTKPFLRNFDVLQGHSWADGSGNDEAGTNQESSSESLNFASGLIMWGEATGDRAMRDLGIYLYVTEINSVETYYFDINQTDAFPEAFLQGTIPNQPAPDRPEIPFPHNASGVIGGFVGIVQSNFAGIQMIPLTGGSYYLGRDTAFVQRLYNWASQNTSQTGQVPIKTPSYLTLLYPYLALANPDQAMSLYLAAAGQIGPVNPGLPIDTDGFNLHWIGALQAYGQLDTTVRSDAVSSLVFNKAGVRTFVGYNEGELPKSVSFYDSTGKLLLTQTIAPRTILVTDVSGTTIVARTTPDYSLQTPSNRFFLTSPNGAPGLLQGKTGLGNESYLEIPGDGTELTFTITGVNGTVIPGAVLEDYAMYYDTNFRADGSGPTVQVSFTYTDSVQTPARTITFIQNALGPLPGYVLADGSTLLTGSPPTGAIPTRFDTLTNATVTVKVKQIDTFTPQAIRLRTNAAAAQGRTSYFTLPYRLSSATTTSVTQLSAQSTTVESTESDPVDDGSMSQTVTALGILADRSARYVASLENGGTGARLTGGTTPETLVMSASGGLLKHNLASTNVPGFASDFDFDSTVPGVQSLPASVASQIAIETPTGAGTVVIGTLLSPASDLRARIIVLNFDTVPDSLTINDSGLSDGLNYTKFLDRIMVGSDRLQVQHSGDFASIKLTTGSGLNTVGVLGVWAKDTLVLDTVRGLDVITIGNGSVKSIFGTVEVRNTRSFSDLRIDNSRDTNAAGTVMITETGITGLAPGQIRFAISDLEDIEILGGTSDTTYQLAMSLDSSYLFLDPGTGQSTVVLGKNGVINPALFPGEVLFTGTQKTSFVADNSQGTAKRLTIKPGEVTGLLDSGISFPGFGSARFVLGAGNDEVEVNGTQAGTAYTLETQGGTNTVRVSALNSPLRVVGDSGQTSLNVRDSSIDSQAYTIAPTTTGGRVSIAGGSTRTIDFQGLSLLQVLLSGRNNTIDATPLATTPIELTSEAGDVLAANNRVFVRTDSLAGARFQYRGPGSGAWTFSASSPLRFQGMASFNAPDATIYVLGLYETVMGRTPGSTEAEAWVAQMDTGMTRSALASIFWRSSEHRGIQVDEQFQNILGRRPTADERAAFVNLYERGFDDLAIRSRLIATDEFNAKTPTSRLFVEGLYRAMPGLSATPQAFNRWVALVNSGTPRSKVAGLFLRSKPSTESFVDSTSLHILGRSADAATRVRLGSALARGQMKPSTIAQRFLASNEYLNRLKSQGMLTTRASTVRGPLSALKASGPVRRPR